MFFGRFEKELSEDADNCTLSVGECGLFADPSNHEFGCHPAPYSRNKPSLYFH
jgi:hypothetical protein